MSFDADGVPAGAKPAHATVDALVHVGREAVTNAVKHANPTLIQVVLQRTDRWRLQVHDDGCGFDAGHANGGFGLESMKLLAQALGGSVRVASTSDGSTTVEAILP